MRHPCQRSGWRHRRGGETAEVLGDDEDGAGVQGDLCEGDDGDEDYDGDGDAVWVTCGKEDVRGDFVVDRLAEHQVAGDGDGDIEGVGEDVGVVDGAGIFCWMAHVAVDVGEHGVTAPGRHEEAEGEGEVGPALRPEGGDDGGAERAR